MFSINRFDVIDDNMVVVWVGYVFELSSGKECDNFMLEAFDGRQCQ